MQFRQREEQLNAVIESNPNIFTKKDIGGNSVYYCPGSEHDWFDCYAIHIPAGDGSFPKYPVCFWAQTWTLIWEYKKFWILHIQRVETLWCTYNKNGGDKMKKHCILWTVVITLIVSWFLFFPWSKQVFEDGGTIVYSSFTYKIYIWNSIGGKNTTEIYYFPFNFKYRSGILDKWSKVNDSTLIIVYESNNAHFNCRKSRTRLIIDGSWTGAV